MPWRGDKLGHGCCRGLKSTDARPSPQWMLRLFFFFFRERILTHPFFFYPGTPPFDAQTLPEVKPERNYHLTQDKVRNHLETSDS